MSTDELYVSLGLILGGLAGVLIGLLRRLGRGRLWYLVPNYYVLLPKGASYAMPLIGLMLILAGISLFMPSPELVRMVWLYGVFPMGFLAILVVGFRPSWLKPTWVRWLEDNYSDILDILIEEGRKTPDWSERVRTQEGLEKWVEEVQRKRGLK